MAYRIQKLPPAVASELAAHLRLAVIADGRFTCGISVAPTRHATSDIEIRVIRLTTAKPYCGNHPGPCRMTGTKRAKRNYLEWADWVAFNDLINDVLDEYNVAADVRALRSIRIRNGPARRIHYGWVQDKHGPGHHEIDPEGAYCDFKDWRGLQAPRATHGET